MPSMKIKKGDQVRVISGKDKGSEGKVIDVDPSRRKVRVEGVHMIKKHKKETHTGARGAKEGGVVTEEAYFDASNVMLLDPEDGKPARVGYRVEEVDGKQQKVRISRRTGKDI